MLQVAFTDSGAVYSFWIKGPRHALYKLNKSTLSWDVVGVSKWDFANGRLIQSAPPAFFLLGVDGNRLVFLAQRKEGQKNTVNWFEEPAER